MNTSIAVPARLTVQQVSDFFAQAESACESNLELDCRETVSIDGAGLQTLLALTARCRLQGQKLHLANVSAALAERLRRVGMHRLIGQCRPAALEQVL